MIVLLSGGLDSTVLLHHAVSEGANVKLCLSLDYGQLHKKEVEYAQWQAERLKLSWKLLDIKAVFQGIESPLLGQGEIPDKSYAEQLAEKEGTVATYVPNRNMLLLSIAAAHAISLGAKQVAYAAHMDDADRGAYPDCTPLFFKRMDNVLKTQGVGLYAPWLEQRLTKKDIVKRGLELNVPFEHTWSCYRGGEIPCGTCGTCLDRAAAFAANNRKESV